MAVPNDRPSIQKLLDLFSVDALKSAFDFKGAKEAAIYDLSARLTMDEVREFAWANHRTTRQHVRILEHSETDPSDLPGSPLRVSGKVGESSTDDTRTFFYLLDLDYEIIIDRPLDKIKVTHLWPVHVECAPSRTIITLTIMSKSSAAFKDEVQDRPIVKVLKPFDDDSIVQMLCTSLPDSTRAEDLNRGIKALWESGKIDANSARWRKARASARQTMDESFTIRNDDKEVYEELLKNPMYTTNFDWFGRGQEPGDASVKEFAFSVNPTMGLFVFRRYPRGETDANAVIREVLRNN